MKSLPSVLVFVALAACGSSSVPDVTGQTFEEASERLEAEGYKVEQRGVHEVDAEIGTVVRTAPSAGEELEEGETVVVEVAEAFTLTGTVTISGSAVGDQEGACQGSGGYSDMRPGASVVVMDGTGTTLATGTLLKGEVDEERSQRLPIRRADPWIRITCVLPLTVSDIPHAQFYEVEVGRRGGLTYSFKEMEAQDWTVELVLN